MLLEKLDRSEGFQGRNVAAAGHDHVRLAAAIAARPLPDSQARRAVLDRLIHGQPLRRDLLAGDDDVHVVAAAQAVVGDGQQAIGVRRQIDAHDLRLLVHHVVDEAGVLMAEPVVILPPDVARQEVVERSDRPAPLDMIADLQPLRMLIEHGIDDVDERLVAREESVPAGEQVAFEPALALMLAQHLHHPSVGGEMVVIGEGLGDPGAVRHFEHVLPAVGIALVRAEQAEVARFQV